MKGISFGNTAAVIDYEKAFDNIQRLILFNILKSRNIPDRILCLSFRAS